MLNELILKKVTLPFKIELWRRTCFSIQESRILLLFCFGNKHWFFQFCTFYKNYFNSWTKNTIETYVPILESHNYYYFYMTISKSLMRRLSAFSFASVEVEAFVFFLHKKLPFFFTCRIAVFFTSRHAKLHCFRNLIDLIKINIMCIIS